MVRMEATADDSFEAIFARRNDGMAMAAMIKMIATTIRSSMRENPFIGFFMVTLADLDAFLSVPIRKKFWLLIGSKLRAISFKWPGTLRADFALIAREPLCGGNRRCIIRPHQAPDKRANSDSQDTGKHCGEMQTEEDNFGTLRGAFLTRKREEAKLPPLFQKVS